MISFVIPARDEEALLPATLEQLHRSARAVGEPFEVIVVDDDSQDRTAAIAREQGARVVPVKLHKIGAVRNAGAKAATGETLIFLDADTLLPEATLRAAVKALEAGAVGGGGAVKLDDQATLRQRVLTGLFAFGWLRICGWAAGCFIFCRRDAFEAVGGFDETWYAAEERFMTVALKTQGRFVILRQPVITSARKMRLYSTWQLIRIAVPTLLGGKRRLQRSEGLEILYDAPREQTPEAVPSRHFGGR